MKVHIYILLLTILLSACGELSEPLTPPPPEKIKKLSVTDFEQQLEILTVDEFFSQSFRQLLLRDPEQVLRKGLAEELSMTTFTYSDISTVYQNETVDFYNVVLRRLVTYSVDGMSILQRQHLGVYQWWLEDQLALMSYPYLKLNATQALTLNDFFIGLHSIVNESEAVNYVEQLAGLSDKYLAMLIQMEARQTSGIIDPSVVLQHVVGQLNQLISLNTLDDPIYQYFTQALAITGITESRQQELSADVQDLLEEKIRPAQSSLTKSLEVMLTKAPVSIGLGQYPKGDDYYETLLKHHLTTPITAEQLFQLGNDELTRVQHEILTTFDRLGYPIGENFEQLYNRLKNDGPMIYKQDVVSTFEMLVSDAEILIPGAFNVSTLPELSVVDSTQDGYFPATKDGSELSRFVTDTRSDRPYYLMPSLAYHEAIPGHHLQSVITQSLQLPLLRTQPRITVYIEGWGLYAERLAFELGWFGNDDSANLGRLQWEALRAARLIADVGVNVKGWSWDEAVTFLSQNTGLPTYAVTDFVARFVVNPGQATAYTVGMVKLLELREKRKLAQGLEFTLANFHQQILEAGPMPLFLLSQYLDSIPSE
jgi:uncharacterized protein (DUF885 family)